MIQTTTLRPGLLVSLSVRTVGNVRYITKTLEAEHLTEGGETRAAWETERIVSDAEELEKSKVARSRCATLIRRVCSLSAFGLLCPEDKAAELETAIADARKVAEDFNATATVSRIGVYIITGRIAADDVEAVKAIKSEVRDLMAEMERGMKTLNVKAIRDAADKAKQMGQMLSADASARVEIAVEVARKAARQISKAGEQAEIEVDQIALQKVASMRTAFLDLEETGAVQAPAAQSRAIDLEVTD